jgi:hypothetical protein
MNWLTTQLARLQRFGDLATDSFDVAQTELRRLRYASAQDALRSLDVSIDSKVPLEPYFILVENVESAVVRAERATPASPGRPLPLAFTLALDDGKGTVLYLPEDNLPTQSLQLFDLVDQRISRIRADGTFDETHAQIYTVNAQPPSRCSDGPCQEWGEACGGGCECQKREVAGSILASVLPTHFISGPGHTYTLVCE